MTGRKTFYYGELRQLEAAEAIVKAFKSRHAAASWTEWAASHPALASMLFEAEELYATNW